MHPARRARSARRDPVSLSACGFLFATVFWSLLSPWWLVAALRHITATRAGVMAMLDPVLAVVVAWLWLGESLDLTQSSGAAVTVAGIALAQTSR